MRLIESGRKIGMTSKLSVRKKEQLSVHEAIIDRGMLTFVEVGNALRVIQDDQLYLDTADTFEDYCKTRWDFSRQRAYQLIEAAGVCQTMSTIVDIAPPKRENL